MSKTQIMEWYKRFRNSRTFVDSDPHCLTVREIENDIQIRNSFQKCTKKIITDDESKVYGYETETKQQSSQWKRQAEPRL